MFPLSFISLVFIRAAEERESCSHPRQRQQQRNDVTTSTKEWEEFGARKKESNQLLQLHFHY